MADASCADRSQVRILCILRAATRKLTGGMKTLADDQPVRHPLAARIEDAAHTPCDLDPEVVNSLNSRHTSSSASRSHQGWLALA